MTWLAGLLRAVPAAIRLVAGWLLWRRGWQAGREAVERQVAQAEREALYEALRRRDRIEAASAEIRAAHDRLAARARDRDRVFGPPAPFRADAPDAALPPGAPGRGDPPPPGGE